MQKLYKIIIHDGQRKVYDENLPFTRIEPNLEDIIGFMRLIKPEFLLLKPDFIFDKVEWVYLRELNDSEL